MSVLRFAAGSVAVVLYALMNLAASGSGRVPTLDEQLGRWS